MVPVPVNEIIEKIQELLGLPPWEGRLEVVELPPYDENTVDSVVDAIVKEIERRWRTEEPSDCYGYYDIRIPSENGDVEVTLYPNYTDADIAEIMKRPKFHEITNAWMDAIPWNLIRPTWSNNIDEIIVEFNKCLLTTGDVKKCFEEAEESLEKGLWIYDYQHVYDALQKIKPRFLT